MVSSMIGKLHIIVAVAGCSLATSAIAAQQRWSVTEGMEGEPHGVWTIETQGEDLTAFAEMFDANGQKTTYFFSGKREKGQYFFDRQDVGDKPKCTYTIPGEPPITGDALSGAIDCDNPNKTWLAKKIPEPVEIQITEEKTPNIPNLKLR